MPPIISAAVAVYSHTSKKRNHGSASASCHAAGTFSRKSRPFSFCRHRCRVFFFYSRHDPSLVGSGQPASVTPLPAPSLFFLCRKSSQQKREREKSEWVPRIGRHQVGREKKEARTDPIARRSRRSAHAGYPSLAFAVLPPTRNHTALPTDPSPHVYPIHQWLPSVPRRR